MRTQTHSEYPFHSLHFAVISRILCCMCGIDRKEKKKARGYVGVAGSPTGSSRIGQGVLSPRCVPEQTAAAERCSCALSIPVLLSESWEGTGRAVAVSERRLWQLGRGSCQQESNVCRRPPPAVPFSCQGKCAAAAAAAAAAANTVGWITSDLVVIGRAGLRGGAGGEPRQRGGRARATRS